MSTPGLHARAIAYFGGVLAQMSPADAGRATPCKGWDVAALIEHVVNGNRMAAVILAGGSTEDGKAAFSQPVELEGVLGTYEESAAAAQAAFLVPGALEATVHFPIGDIPATQLLEFRVGDLTLHGWDLARALGTDEAIEPVLVEAVWSQMQPMASFIGQIGVFGDGPSGAHGEDAERQLQLLDLSGRRP